MDLYKTKLEIIRMILETENPTILETLNNFLIGKLDKEFIDANLLSDKVNFEKADKEMNDGDFIDNEHIGKIR